MKQLVIKLISFSTPITLLMFYSGYTYNYIYILLFYVMLTSESFLDYFKDKKLTLRDAGIYILKHGYVMIIMCMYSLWMIDSML